MSPGSSSGSSAGVPREGTCNPLPPCLPEAAPTEYPGSLLLVHASELVTLRGARGARRGKAQGELSVIRDGAVFCEGGAIRAVGRSEPLLRRYQGAAQRILNCSGRLVLPGFVDAHTHLVYAGDRADELELKAKGATYAEILHAGGGIHRTVAATQRASPEELTALARARLESMLRHGTTTAEAKSGYGLRAEAELKLLRVLAQLQGSQPVRLVPTYLGAHAVPKGARASAKGFLEQEVLPTLPSVASEGLAKYADVFCDRGVFTVAQARQVLEAARHAGLGLKLHADELAHSGGTRLAAELRTASADHLAHATDADLRAYARAGGTGVLLPGTAVTTPELPRADARHWVRAGLPVALGTDLNPNCPIHSMPLIIGLAVYRHGLTPAQALVAATLNAAASCGVDQLVGSIELGKRADLLIADLPTYQHLPYELGRNPITTVIRDGAVVWERPVG